MGGGKSSGVSNLTTRKRVANSNSRMIEFPLGAFDSVDQKISKQTV